MGRAVDLLAEQMADAYTVMRRCVDGVTDAAFFWAPAPGSWTVFRDEQGDWTHDYAESDPVPAPFTTIGWRLTHVAMCKVMYHEWAFGPRALTWDTIETPHDVAGALEMIERGQVLLGEDLGPLRDEDLDRPALTNWGEEWPTWKIFWTMAHHDLQHGGEIGALLDLYRVTMGKGGAAGAN